MGIIIRQSFKGTLANYIGILIGYVNLVFLFPLYFSEAQIGVIRFLLEAVVVISGFSMLGANQSLVRFYPKILHKKNDRGLPFLVLSIVVIGFLAFVLVALLFKAHIMKYFSERAGELLKYFVFIMPLLFIHMIFNLTETYASIKGRIAVPKLLKDVFMRAGLSVAAVFFGYDYFGFQGVILFIICWHFVLLIFNIFYLKILTKFDLRPDFSAFPKGIIKEFWIFTGLILASSFTSVVLPRLDFIMVSSMKGMGDTGIYSTAFYLAMVIDIPKRAISQISNPIMSKFLHEGDYDKVQDLYKRSSIIQTLIGGLIFLVIWINLNTVFRLMPNGELYSTGAWVCFFIGIGKVIDMICGVGTSIIWNSNFYKYSVLMGVIATAVAIGGNLLFIPQFGITGAAISTCVAFSLLSFYTIGIIKYKLGIHPLGLSTLKLGVLIVIAIVCFEKMGYQGTITEELLVNNLFFTIPVIVLCYALKISTDFNSEVKKILQRLNLKL